MRAPSRCDLPGVFFLAPDDLAGLESWLRAARLLREGERVSAAAPAGAGNMNCTLRVAVGDRTLIVKQARPWVEKYPQFAAPADRSHREREFYQLAGAHPVLRAGMPALLHADDGAGALVIEDVGTAGDYTDLYGGRNLAEVEMVRVARWLGALHGAFDGPPAPGLLANRAMRELNHRHIFDLPLQDGNGLNLDQITPGLEAEARRLRADAPLTAEAAALGRRYLADGARLVHGDFFPGSLLRGPAGPKVIDPEFAHFGRAEFDVGVWLGHLRLAGQPAETEDLFWAAYVRPEDFSVALARQFAGLEIIRRLLGYAQLPLAADLARKAALLREARALVLGGPGLPAGARWRTGRSAWNAGCRTLVHFESDLLSGPTGQPTPPALERVPVVCRHHGAARHRQPGDVAECGRDCRGDQCHPGGQCDSSRPEVARLGLLAAGPLLPDSLLRLELLVRDDQGGARAHLSPQPGG